MHRCLELAALGAGQVAPNPMVGAVLMYENRIIGEGWHAQYGHAHAEVNCIAAVRHEDLHLLPQSTLYVSLEPCAHYGKTPPCTSLIIEKKIPKVIIGCRDPFKLVNGKGIEKLNATGITTETGILETECRNLNKRFFTFHSLQRPYIILKWAESADGYIGNTNGQRLLISNEYSNRLVHRWRSEEAAVMVGTQTALLDNPQLTTRHWPGKSPLRIVIDRKLRLPRSLHLFSNDARTIVFNELLQEEKGGLLFYRLTPTENLIPQILDALFQLAIQSVIIEGGAQLLQSFIDANLWDEARVITNENLHAGNGVNAPQLINAVKTGEESLQADKISYFKNSVQHLAPIL